MEIPFYSLAEQHKPIKARIMQALETVFDSNLYILGPSVKRFENEYANFNQTKFCISVANGLDALHLSLQAIKIKKNDEIIVPSNTYIATWLAASFMQAKILPVEPDPATCNIDPSKIEEVITPNTRAIIPVHLYGQACEMEAIMSIAQKYNLFVIEDNAQAQGAMFKNQMCGSFGHLNATSFYPGKNLGALGDAGAITTNDITFDEKVRTLRNYGSKEKYFNELIGQNSRMDEIQASILSVKLQQLVTWNLERIKIAEIYNKALELVGDLILPTVAKNATHVFHL